MRYEGWKNITLNKRLLVLTTSLLLISAITIGYSGYTIAKHQLDQKGETILKNSVKMAKMLIASKYKEVQSGQTDEAEAIENIKETLQGKLQNDGTRLLHHNIDLGENGYFIIYDLKGNEVMHPTLEGQNVLDVQDPSVEGFYLVKDQIKKGLGGGGFTYYTWQYPYSNNIGRKVTYSEYDEHWKWIVVASSYTSDFNQGAYDIIKVLIFASTLLLALGIVGSKMFVERITMPIHQVLEGMKAVEKGEYSGIPLAKTHDEVGMLTSGYNQMIMAINDANAILQKQAEHIRYLAFYDELSQLPNRNQFKNDVDDRISEIKHNGYLLQIDLFEFSMINSTIGFENGNTIIQQIGKSISEMSKNVKYVARISGNEFCIWLEGLKVEDIEPILIDLKKKITHQLNLMEINQNIDFYSTLAIYPEHGCTFEVLYNKASIAMKYAKEGRILKTFLYQEEMEFAFDKEIQIRNHLKGALQNEEISIVYQCKVDATTNEIVGVEALARWFSSNLGFVSPGVFIPAIHQTNLTVEFGDYILTKVLKEYSQLTEKYNKNITVSINISPLFFLEKGFIERVKNKVTTYNIPAERVILEITEDIFINDFKLVDGIIRELKQAGFKISLDDFGTRYSSLNYLMNLNIDELKIDKSFVDQILSDEKAHEMFKIVCNIAEVFDYDIVAEGVETMEQLEIIAQAGVRIIQGYLFSRPEGV